MDEAKVMCGRCGKSWEPGNWFCREDGEILVIGRAIGGEWVLEKRLGADAMRAVYRARHRLSHQLAAVKLLGLGVLETDDDEEAARFLRESLVRVRHPSCVEIHDLGRIPGVRGKGTSLWWLRMNHVEGHTLDLLVDRAPLDVAEVIGLGVQMCAGLQACHAAGVIHRDLKPANVLVEAATGLLRVADFGLARSPGHPAYMAPELPSAGPADVRSDLFALGVMLFELLTGKHPFLHNEDIPLFMGRPQFSPPPRLSSLTAADVTGIDPIVMRLLEMNPIDRFASAAEVRDALLDLAEVNVHVVNADLELTSHVTVRRSLPLADVRRKAIAAATTLSSVARRILESPGTDFGWDVKGTRLADTESVARACELGGDALAVELHLRVYRDVLLGG